MTREERIAYDQDADPILFYSPRDKNGMGSNFSNHGIVLPNPFTNQMAWYATGEHRYQAMKADNLDQHELVRMTGRPSEAKNAGRIVRLRDGWGSSYGDMCYYVMLEVILEKAVEHWEVRAWLNGTKDHIIYEDSPTDDIWGWRNGRDYSGKNLLGRCWMQARDLLS